MVGERKPLDAVGWLLGPDLLSRLRMILRSRRDPRAWMAVFPGFVHDECGFRDGRLIPRGRAPTSDGDRAIAEVANQDAAARGATAAPAAEPQELWFDYLADMGDANDAMYAVAYACQTDLELAVPDGAALPTALPGEPRWRNATPRRAGEPRGNLPRGAFLMIGGDSAYHVADAVTLQERVQTPFTWAYEDLGWREQPPDTPPPRLYGIPGNHDWYDDLEGFARLFRRDGDLALSGFQSVQLASHVAIQLPHGWQLWGLDIYNRGLDERQRDYFNSLDRSHRMILCTPSPPIVFGDVHADDDHVAALRALDLPPVFDDPSYPIDPDHRRLDLSGDIHHYARYSAPTDPDAPAPYQAVVSGLGGAFHHPSFTTTGSRKAKRLYPPADESLRTTAHGLLNLTSLRHRAWFGSIPWAFAALVGGASFAGGAGWLLGKMLSWLPGVGDESRFGDRGELGRSLVLTAVLAAAIAAIVFVVVRLGRGRTPRGALALLIGAVAAVDLFSFTPLAPDAYTAWSDVSVIIYLLLGLIGGPAAAYGYGGKDLPWMSPRRLGLGLLGLVHGISLITTPLLCTRMVGVDARTAIVAAIVVIATWLLLIATRGPFAWAGRRGSVFVCSVIALIAWLGGMAALVIAAGGSTVHPTSVPVALGKMVILGGVTAMVLCMMYFAWYLAIAGRLDGHNNEVGGTARVTTFRQMIRFHLTAERLTGYVIECSDADTSPLHNRGKGLRCSLIDVFTIETPG
jgi:hypothetical protein